MRPHEVIDHENALSCPCLLAGLLCCARPHDDGTPRIFIYTHNRNVARARRGDGHP